MRIGMAMRGIGAKTFVSMLMVTAAGSALAQGNPPTTAGPIEEIVVSALKREQSIQEVPASVTALGAADLARSGLVSSYDLQQLVPGLSISLANRETNVAIRGVSNNVRSIGADPSNAVHVNGIYLPQSSMVLTEFFDVQRVEVLKGPEGTLYGRNATGGAINVIANAPEAGVGAAGFVGFGSDNLRRAQAAVNVGNDAVAGRFALAYTKDDGYTRNLQTDSGLDAQDFLAARGQLRFGLGADADLTLFVQVTRDDGTVGYGTAGDPSFPIAIYPYNGDPAYGLNGRREQRVDARNVRLDAPIESRRDSEIYGATLDWNFGAVNFRSITGYTNYDAGDFNDFDFTGRQLETQRTTTEVQSFSQEFQLSSAGTGPLEWTLGAFIYEDESSQFLEWLLYNEANFFGTPGPAALARVNTENESSARAIFGQATYRLTDQWAVLVGARYNDEEKTGVQQNLRRNTVARVEADFQSFTPKGQIQFQASDDVLVYAGVTKGFKSGGFNLLGATPAVFDPEEVVAYEAGVKSRLADGRVIFNVSAFYYDYSDLQLRTLVLSGGAPIATVSNASSAEITGLEIFTEAQLGGGFALDLAGTYIDSELQDYISPSNRRNLSGTRLPLSPEWSGVAGLNYETPAFGGEITTRIEVSYRSEIIFPLSIDETNNFDEELTLVNATARWTAPDGRFYVELIGRNLTDELYRTQRSDVPFANVFEGFGPPRTVEARLGFSF